jgi:pimeloyl-ACP methyl ester carboxylesterase
MQPILLLHGAIGAAVQLEPLKAQLEQQHKVYTTDFSGHGSRAFPEKDFSIALFAADVLQFMQEQGLERVSVFGYSMGGYVAMYLAKHHPDKIDKVITLATKFHWDAETAQKEIQMLNAEKIEAKVPAFADSLRNRHTGKDWKKVLQRTADMLQALGADNTLKTAAYKEVSTPVMILLGDRDKMVSLDETVAVYKELPNAVMGILPGTPHPIEQVDVKMLGFFIGNFLGRIPTEVEN